MYSSPVEGLETALRSRLFGCYDIRVRVPSFTSETCRGTSRITFIRRRSTADEALIPVLWPLVQILLTVCHVSRMPNNHPCWEDVKFIMSTSAAVGHNWFWCRRYWGTKTSLHAIYHRVYTAQYTMHIPIDGDRKPRLFLLQKMQTVP